MLLVHCYWNIMVLFKFLAIGFASCVRSLVLKTTLICARFGSTKAIFGLLVPVEVMHFIFKAIAIAMSFRCQFTNVRLWIATCRGDNWNWLQWRNLNLVLLVDRINSGDWICRLKDWCHRSITNQDIHIQVCNYTLHACACLIRYDYLSQLLN